MHVIVFIPISVKLAVKRLMISLNLAVRLFWLGWMNVDVVIKRNNEFEKMRFTI